MASHAKPSMEIELEDGKVKIIAKAAFFTQTMVFPINEPYEQEYEGIKMKVILYLVFARICLNLQAV